MNRDLIKILTIDLPKSFIWTDRYNKYGDFELYFSTRSIIYSYILKKYYLMFSLSEHLMIVESMLITTDSTTGDLVKVTGRSLESILDRRIVWGQLDIQGTPQEIIQTLLNQSIINPIDSDRKINNFVFEASTDTRITSLSSVTLQFTGDNLYEVISNICKAYGIGFKVYFDELKRFVFKLYVGQDRSQAQTTNPYVIFSPEYDNIVSSEYFTSDANEKNVNLVAGEGEGASRKMIQCGSGVGIDRKEMFTDASDISSDVDGTTLTDAQYNARMLERGNTEMAQYTEEEMFSGQAETTRTYIYNKDFFMGDLVQTSDAYSHAGRSLISEFIFAVDTSGIKMYPTFENM